MCTATWLLIRLNSAGWLPGWLIGDKGSAFLGKCLQMGGKSIAFIESLAIVCLFHLSHYTSLGLSQGYLLNGVSLYDCTTAGPSVHPFSHWWTWITCPAVKGTGVCQYKKYFSSMIDNVGFLEYACILPLDQETMLKFYTSCLSPWSNIPCYTTSGTESKIATIGQHCSRLPKMQSQNITLVCFLGFYDMKVFTLSFLYKSSFPSTFSTPCLHLEWAGMATSPYTVVGTAWNHYKQSPGQLLKDLITELTWCEYFWSKLGSLIETYLAVKFATMHIGSEWMLTLLHHI